MHIRRVFEVIRLLCHVITAIRISSTDGIHGEKAGLHHQESPTFVERSITSGRRLQSLPSTQRKTYDTYRTSAGDCENHLSLLIETSSAATADLVIAALEEVLAGTKPLLSNGMTLDSSSFCEMDYNLTHVYDMQPLEDNPQEQEMKKATWLTKTNLFIIIGAGGALVLVIMATLLIRIWVAKKKNTNKTSKVATQVAHGIEGVNDE